MTDEEYKAARIRAGLSAEGKDIDSMSNEERVRDLQQVVTPGSVEEWEYRDGDEVKPLAPPAASMDTPATPTPAAGVETTNPFATERTAGARKIREAMAAPGATADDVKTVQSGKGDKRLSAAQYGNWAKVTDADGNVQWRQMDDRGRTTDADGNPLMPASERRRLALLERSKSWDEAVKQQQAQKAERSFEIARQKADENNAVLSTRRQRGVKQNLKIADNLGAAAANLQKNLADIQAHIKDGGSIENSGAYLSSDGNYYVRGIVAPSGVDMFNREMAELGGKDALEKIVVSQQVDRYGNPINGAEPTFAALYMRDGITGKGSGKYVKNLTLSEALRAVSQAHLDDGRDKEQLNGYLAGVFGAENAAKYGYGPTTSEKERIERMKQENMNNRANMRQEQFDKKFALEQQKLDEQTQGRLAAAKSAEEKNAILKKAKDAEMKLRQEEIESKYAQMGAQYGFGETRKAAQEKIAEKLAPSPADDKATLKPGDNTGDGTAAPGSDVTGGSKTGAPSLEEARKTLLATGKYKIDEKTGKIVKK